MPANDQLIELIQALTPSEKRSFKLSARQTERKEKKHYLLLFDHLDRCGKVDKTKLGKSKEGKKILLNLPYFKNYLYHQLLKSLRQSAGENDLRIRMYESITDIRILINKGLIDQARKKISSYKKQLKHYHFDLLLMDLQLVERNIIRGFDSKDSFKRMERIQKASATVLTQYKNRLQILDIYDKIFLLARNRSLRDLNVEETREIARNSEKGLIELDLSFEGKIAYHLLFFIYYQQFSESIIRSKFHLKAIIDDYHRNPDLLKEHALRYVHLLNSYFNTLYIMGEFSEFPQIVEQLSNLKTNQKTLQLKVRYLLRHMMLLKNIKEHDHSAVKKILPELEDELSKFSKQIPQNDLIMLKQSMALGSFAIEDYNATLDWTRHLLNEVKNDIRQDVRLLCAQLELIVYFQRGEEDLVESVARSIIRLTQGKSVDKHNGKFALELARTFRKAVNLTTAEKVEMMASAVEVAGNHKTFINGKDEIVSWLKSWIDDAEDK